jgi:hypothetical protein
MCGAVDVDDMLDCDGAGAPVAPPVVDVVALVVLVLGGGATIRLRFLNESMVIHVVLLYFNLA